MESQSIDKCNAERNNITEFVSQKGYKIENLVSEVGNNYFSDFVARLVSMNESLDNAELYANNNNFDGAIELIVRAKMQKDLVYGSLLASMGEKKKGQWEVTGCYVPLRDYVMHRFENRQNTIVSKLELYLAGGNHEN